MSKVLRYAIQLAMYVAFGAVVGYFSSFPVFQVLPADHALVRLSFGHASKPVAPCRERTDEELAKLPPNMRVKLDCPRERSPVRVQIEMDDEPLYDIRVLPAGLKRDGVATVYRRLAVPAGRHEFEARLSDTADGAFGYSAEEVVELAPGKVLLIDFNAAEGGFVFRR